jgi:hypothetical protein
MKKIFKTTLLAFDPDFFISFITKKISLFESFIFFHSDTFRKQAAALFILFATFTILAIETEDGFLLEGDRTDYNRYDQLEYTPQIESLRGTIVDNSKVFLIWEKIPYNNVTYTIYRNTVPLDTYSAFQTATIIAKITDKSQLLDQTITSSGRYYYGITTKKRGMREDLFLFRNKSFLDRPFIIRNAATRNPQPAQESNERATIYLVNTISLNEQDNSLLINWTVPESFNGYSNIYVSRNPVNNRESLQQSRRLARVTQNSYRVTPIPSTQFYITVLLESNGQISYAFNSNNTVQFSPNNVNQPIQNENQTQFDSSETTNYNNNDIDSIVRKIYKGENLDSLERQLVQIARSATDEGRKAKAVFLIGRIKVEKGEYAKALRYFSRDDVKQYHKTESEFWLDYCLSKLN